MVPTVIARAVLRAASSAIVLMDPQGRVTTMNREAEALLGTTSEAALGRSYEAVFGPSLAARMIPLFLHVARSGSHQEAQTVEATLPSGRRASLQAAIGPITESDGTLVGILFAADENGAATSPGGHSVREKRYLEAVRRYAGDHIALARLQALAGPGELVCSRASLEAAGPGIAAVALGEIPVKGRVAPVAAYRVQAVSS